ncbi:B-cell antigen receptor complex-associated protein alpha chain isoform X2 [Sphaerodactylus townsendi]|uniref:B-cell antigen receptor complex-associated protein alpha chain isoform X2 n=1 Tax=Sphaerodactylus townsendi TaxID=933632 RepID=UPI00202704D6|nr:B-cell antigen receptor complex-associated protein alpha chain isoform X2 [Sphaerodactylus townsendi]
MDGNPQRLYALVLLGLFAGHFCGLPDPGTNAEPFNVSDEDEATTKIMLLSEDSRPASKVKTMSQTQNSVNVNAVPTSLLSLEGHDATLKCTFKAPRNVEVFWRRSCYPNCSQTFRDSSSSANPRLDVRGSWTTLSFQQAETKDSGMYYCVVNASGDIYQSCGTFLWVRRPRPTSFLNIRESVKNKIITAEGFLLLICAIGPGLFLLLRRWENESLLQAKKKYEEENLYEGLNLDECSMYEDISRGLQATYQDIGTVKVIDLQLEKPEKP